MKWDNTAPVITKKIPILIFKAIGVDAVDDIDSAGARYKVSKALKLTFAPHSVNIPKSIIAIKLIRNKFNQVYALNHIGLIGLLPANQLTKNTNNGIIARYAAAEASMRRP